VYSLPDIRDIVALALAEDLGVSPSCFAASASPDPSLLARDVTGFAAIDADARFSGRIVVRGPAVVAGLSVAAAVFEAFSASVGLFESIEVFPLVAEGARVDAATSVMEVEGVATAVLAAERTALNFLMMLSGIATETARWVAEAEGAFVVCDTRKTSPGMRALSKYAVAVGGGTNHRSGLFDMALVKDNHIDSAGGITAAVGAVRATSPGVLVEVEADTVIQAVEAVRAGADLVLLDNMSDEALAEAVSAVKARAQALGRQVITEASGGITFERLRGLRTTGVDRVSASAVTVGAKALDFGLDEGTEEQRA
jgi:nicotinate-nucleotide pyrophosphorylase (carboxylating)